MTCLTFDESEKWFAQRKVRIDGNRDLWFPGSQEKLMFTLQQRTLPLHFFAARVTKWLSAVSSRFLWLSNWNTDPADQIEFFQLVRGVSGEARRLIDAPGHIFEPVQQEAVLLTGLSFLIVSFNWEAYIVTQHSNAFVYLGDEHVVFSSEDPRMMSDLTDLAGEFKLKRISDIREAWNYIQSGP